MLASLRITPWLQLTPVSLSSVFGVGELLAVSEHEASHIAHVLCLVLGKLDNCGDRFGQMAVMFKAQCITEHSYNLRRHFLYVKVVVRHN